MLTGEDLQALVAQLDASDLDEFEVQIRDMTVVLRRHGAGGWTKEAVVTRHPRVFGDPAPHPVAPGPISPTGAQEGGPTTTGSAVDEANRSAVYPPLLGTFYRAPSPDAPSFVEVGDVVAPDTVVGIVETMKMMNSVPAGVAGTVVEIVKGDAEFTDSGDVLMWIETAR